MSEKIVNAPIGRIRGDIQEGIAQYRGIPYAESPAGEQRYRHAVKVRPHAGILDASEFGPISPQQGRALQDESSCLSLNIWAPENAEGLPVFFFIHGGSFIYGAGSHPLYDGTLLAREGNMIVVTFNYRLGPLGCLDLSTVDPRFQANCAFSDMAAALTWVYENIEAFGGDPEQITVAGQSAGAISASAFPVNPDLKHMVSKVIMMSGSPTYLRPLENHQAVSEKFFEFTGFSDPQELLDADARTIMDLGKKFQSACQLGEGTFTLSVDGDTIPVSPIHAALEGEAAGIPIFMGTTREEMSFATSPLFSNAIDIKGYIDQALQQEEPQALEQLMQEYEREYGDRGRSLFFAERAFRMGSLWYGQACSRKAPVWLYRFDFESRAMRWIGLRACHSSDLPLIFGNIRTGFFPFMYVLDCVKQEHRVVMKEMQQDIYRFVHHGELPWAGCTDENVTAKIYDRDMRMEPVMAERTRAAFELTNFHADAFGHPRSA